MVRKIFSSENSHFQADLESEFEIEAEHIKSIKGTEVEVDFTKLTDQDKVRLANLMLISLGSDKRLELKNIQKVVIND